MPSSCLLLLFVANITHKPRRFSFYLLFAYSGLSGTLVPLLERHSLIDSTVPFHLMLRRSK